MKKSLLLATLYLLSYLLSSGSHAAEDTLIKPWEFTEGRKVVAVFNQYSRAGGGSGYSTVRNLTNQKVKVCWDLVFNSNKLDEGCSTLEPFAESDRASCYSCSPKNSGVKSVVLRTFEYL